MSTIEDLIEENDKLRKELKKRRKERKKWKAKYLQLKNHDRYTKEGYQRNKYLDDLGIPIEKYGTNFLDNRDYRWQSWMKEQKEYGFDARECWNLDITFVEWLYSHLSKYLEDTIVNTEYHHFEYRETDESEPKDVTFGEAIDIIREACKEYLKSPEFDREFLPKNIMILLGDIMPALWW